jgi:chromosome segregation ATPase
MVQDFIELFVGLAGMAVGAVLALVFLRVRSHDLIEAAVAHGRAGLQAEVAIQQERSRGLEAELVAARLERQQVQAQESDLRRQLEQALVDKARLGERAARAQALESELARVTLQLRMAEVETRRLGSAEAQKAYALQVATQQLAQARQEHSSLLPALHALREVVGGLAQRMGA